MSLLITIRDSDIGSNSVFPETFSKRVAARMVLFDELGQIALMVVGKSNYHKLPGGGLEKDETVEEALEREILEETGCHFSNPVKIGIIEEYLAEMGVFQTSHCFIGHVKSEKNPPQFDAEEIAQGFSMKWVNLEDAITLLEKEKTHSDYQARFINLRDTTFLYHAQKLRNLA